VPTKIDREELQRLLKEGAQLVEVLPAQEFDEAHLPDAINIPLDELTPDRVAALDRERPVVTYCYDTQCDMSPRAAWRLETLGFGSVYDYAPGKADWMGAGLPIEGSAAGLPTIGSLAHTDVPRCALDDTVDHVRRLLEGSSWDSCFVTNADGIVLGRIYVSQLDAGGSASAADVMDPGPSTYRPDVPAAEMERRMRESDLETAPVTTSDGRLIGLVLRAEVEGAARSQPRADGTGAS
jgi:rhodanese-related sulfurtransferase/CBS domain-containing protein